MGQPTLSTAGLQSPETLKSGFTMRQLTSWTLGGGSLFRSAVEARNPGGNGKRVETGRGVALKLILDGGERVKS